MNKYKSMKSKKIKDSQTYLMAKDLSETIKPDLG